MRGLWFLTTAFLCLQLALTRTLQSIASNQDSGNENTVTVPLRLVPGGFYYAEIGIGTPSQKFKVFFDTWNQNTWITSTKCPADKYPMCANHARYDAAKSSTKNLTTEKFSYVEYGTTVSGTITEDIVTLGGQSVRHPFGEVMATDGNTLDTATFDGTFGIGFPISGSRQPTILRSLVNSGIIKQEVYGIWTKSNADGEIMFGGYNTALYSGELEFVNVFSPPRLVFIVKSIKFGNEDLTGNYCEASVNDGSHHIYGPTKQVKKIYERLRCNPSDLCKVDCNKINTFPDLKIIVNKTEFVIGPKDYIDKEGDNCTGRIFDYDGPTWSLGNLFMNKVYIACDTKNVMIGFAQAKSPTPPSTTTEPTIPTTQSPQPSTTGAASTFFSHHTSMEFLLVVAVLTYLNMLTI